MVPLLSLLARARTAVPMMCIALLGIASVRASEPTAKPESPSHAMVEVEARFVRGPAALFQKVLANADHLGAEVLEEGTSEEVLSALKEGGAEFFSESRLITKSGKRAVIEAVQEMRYPTEFEPSKNELGKVVPLAFEQRNVGVTLEVEPKLGSDGSLDIAVAPQVVTFLGFIDYSTVKNFDPNEPRAQEKLLKGPLTAGGVWQPVFKIQKVSTSLTIFSAQTILVRLPSNSLKESGAPGQPGGNDVKTCVFIKVQPLPEK